MTVPLIYVNGAFVPSERAAISPEDRGFVFGDAIYEVVKVYDGVPFRMIDHLERLEAGASRIRLPLPLTRDELEDVSNQLLAKNELRSGCASLYIQVSRGPGPRVHTFPPECTPTVLVSAVSAPELDATMYASGIRAISVPDRRWHFCDVKSVGLLLSVLAKQDAVEHGADDAIFVRDGIVTEGSSANFFGVRDGRLITHPEGPHILSGITRKVVIETAEVEGIDVIFEGIPSDELVSLDEAFLTGTGIEVLPVTIVDDCRIGSGAVGTTTARIQQRFSELARGVYSRQQYSRA